MMAQILYAFAALVVVGIVLIVIGFRGKKLNNNPVCRGCGFDLQGVLPAGVTCPECGAGLKRPNAVRQGARRKRWVVASMGMLLVLLPLAAFVLVGGAILSGSDINKHKPVGLLLVEARYAGASLTRDAAAELLDRLLTGKLTPEQTKNIARTALDLQADLTRPWCVEWGDFIEHAHTQGVITKDEHERYMNQSAVLECKVRPVVERGASVPVVVKLKESRAGSGSQFMVSILLESATIGGKPAKPATRSGQEVSIMAGMAALRLGNAGGRPIGTLMVGAARTGIFGNFAGWASVTLEPDEGVGAGEARITLSLKCIAQDAAALRTGGFRMANAPPESAKQEIRSITQVVGEDEPTITLIPPSDSTTRLLERALIPTQFMQYTNSLPPTSSIRTQRLVNMTFSIGGVRTPFAFEVSMKYDDKEQRIGEITSGEPAREASDLMAWGGWGGNQRTIVFTADEELPDFVTLIFRPSEDLARRTIDLTEMYNGEIILPSAPVQTLGR